MGSGVHQDLHAEGVGDLALHHRQGGRQREQASGGFLGGGTSGTTGPGWGPDSSPCSDSGDRQGSGEDRGREAVDSPGTGLLPLRWKVCPHVSLLSFHYIQIRSAINFIKSKQSWSENGASRQSCGRLGRRNPGEQGRVVVAAVKRAGGGGLGEGASLQDSPSPGIPPVLWPSTSF